MDQPYTQNQESQDSLMFFPSVFKSRGLDSLLSESKLKDQFILAPRTKLKKSHKSASKPLKSKESLNMQELCPPHYDLCLKDISAWLALVTWHCHSNLPDSHMLESIRNDSKYLFDLYKDVIFRGGWRNMIAFNGWPEITKNYGNIHSDGLRDDYEKYLLSLELINNPTTRLESLSNYTVLQEIQPKGFSTIPTEKLNGSLTEITEGYWNSLLEKEQVVCSGLGDIVLQVDNAHFQYERVVNMNPSRRTRPIIYQISDSILEKQESENHISMKDFFSSTSAQSSFRVTIKINSIEKPNEYFYEKIPTFISPISGSNLLSSHTKMLLGITDPALEILQNVPLTWGADSLPLNKLILNHGPECLYIYSVDIHNLAKLDSKLQEIYDITCDHSIWIPQDLFFLQHGIEVSIHGMKPGDLVLYIQAILSSARFYWIIPKGNSSFSHWCLMHLSIKRLENLLERYNLNPNKKQMMGMRLYSTLIYFLNSKLPKMPLDLKQYLLKFLHNLLADEISKYAKLSSNTPQHDVLKKSKKCRKCFKEILLYFGCCSTCQGSDNKNSYCLDCSGVRYNQRHLCKDPNISYYSKYRHDKITKLKLKINELSAGSEVR